LYRPAIDHLNELHISLPWLLIPSILLIDRWFYVAIGCSWALVFCIPFLFTFDSAQGGMAYVRGTWPFITLTIAINMIASLFVMMAVPLQVMYYNVYHGNQNHIDHLPILLVLQMFLMVLAFCFSVWYFVKSLQVLETKG